MPVMQLHRIAICTIAFALAIGQTGEPTPEVRRLRADLEFLCSRGLQGRVSLQPGADIAATFIATQFADAGLQPGFGESWFQTFSLVEPHLDTQASSLQLKGAKSETF